MSSALVQNCCPTLLFSKGEEYFPCELFFRGRDIKRNREEYEKLDEQKKKDIISCYYRVVEGVKYTAYEYWYYYAFNKYPLIPGGFLRNLLASLIGPLGFKIFAAVLADDHEHDFEFVIVYIDNDTRRPEFLCLNQHFWHNFEQISGNVPPIRVELGGHGMFLKNKGIEKWEDGGLQVKPDPKVDIEHLRANFLVAEPSELIDPKGKLKGDDYDPIGIGKVWGPTVPWSRVPEYYLPETAVLAKVHPITPISPRIAKTLGVLTPPAPSLLERYGSVSIPYAKIRPLENLRLAKRLQLIRPRQYREMKDLLRFAPK